MKGNIYKTGVRGVVYDSDSAWDLYPAFFKKVKLNKKDKILDAGCGEGKLGKYLKGFKLYGFDYSKKAIKKAKNKGYKKVLQGDMGKVPFKNKEFDTSIALGVFQYLKNSDKAFEELIRVTKDKIIISSANFKWFRLKSLAYPKSKKKYKWLIENENFTDKKFFIRLAKKYKLNVKIDFISNKFGSIRNLSGDFLASEVIATYKLK
ncbi:class I SAM-dependent methyltransferase [Nanoarchaeota archaeon]